MPANAGMVFKRLAEVAAFDYFDIGEFVDEFLVLEPTDPVNHKMEAIGFESRQFINNVGTFFFYIAACTVASTIWVFIFGVSIVTTKAQAARKKLGERIFWNRLNSGIMESILIVAFCSLIQFNYNLRFDTWGQKVQTWLAIAAFTIYVLIPLFTLVKLCRNFDQIKEKEFSAQFGALYDDLAVKNGKKVLLEPIAFLLRRVFLAFLIIYGTKVFIWQMTAIFVSTLIVMIITFTTGSLANQPGKRRLQIFAEISILVTSDCFLSFNIVSVEDNFTLGFATIGVIGVYVFVCLVFILHKVAVSMIDQFRRWNAWRIYKSKRKQLAVNLKSIKPLRIQRWRDMRKQKED